WRMLLVPAHIVIASFVSLWNGLQRAEESVLLIVEAGGEENGLAAACCMVIPNFQCPETIDLNRIAVCIFELSIEMAVTVFRKPESVNATVAKIADEQVAGQIAPTRRSDRQTPGRIELTTSRHARFAAAIEVEHVDKAVALTRH